MGERGVLIFAFFDFFLSSVVFENSDITFLGGSGPISASSKVLIENNISCNSGGNDDGLRPCSLDV